MDTEKSKPKTTKEDTTKEPAGATVHTILEQGAEAYGQAEQAASDAYDKTAQKVSETYAQAKSYSHENPGKTLLMALGIGVGLGLLLGASAGARRSRTSRIAQPIVNALSDIAAELFQ